VSNACGALQSIRCCRSVLPALLPRDILSWDSPLVQSIRPLKYYPYWLGIPTLPLAVSSALWFSFSNLDQGCLMVLTDTSPRAWPPSRVFLDDTYPADRSRAESSPGLSVPSAHEDSEVHFARACRLATFRLQGLVTLLTVYSLRARAGLLSYRQRSWDSTLRRFLLAEGTPGVSTWDEPTYRFAQRYSRRRSAGPAR
jgi:hypothetical protein